MTAMVAAAAAPSRALEATIYLFAALACVIAIGFGTAFALSGRHRKWRESVEQELAATDAGADLTEEQLRLLTMGDLMASAEIRDKVIAERATLVPMIAPTKPTRRPRADPR